MDVSFQICKVLWHLDAFRRSFRQINQHKCTGMDCIFCALKELFQQLQTSSDPATFSKQMCQAFATKSYNGLQAPNVGQSYDFILNRIHNHLSGKTDLGDIGCESVQCISHRKFAISILERSVCECNVHTDQFPTVQMLCYVSTMDIIAQKYDLTKRYSSSLSNFIQLSSEGNKPKYCRDGCGSAIRCFRTLFNCPDVFTIGLIWDKDRPILDHLSIILSSIETSMHLNDIFHNVKDIGWAKSVRHDLVGLVSYNGSVYTTFFFHTKLKVWVYFDYTTVKEIGPNWESVLDKCRQTYHQPLLLIYTVSDISTTEKFGQDVAQPQIRRAVTPNPEKLTIGSNVRRAITPTPIRSNCDYQNLSVIQTSIKQSMNQDDIDEVDHSMRPNTDLFIRSQSHDPDSFTQKPMAQQYYNNHAPVQRSVSAENASLSSSTPPSISDGLTFPDHLNQPRRRDSGNWSGDRNSASSASSTTFDNPYQYLVGKRGGNCSKISVLNGRLPNNQIQSQQKQHFDPGYDSYSLSSTDSYPSKQNQPQYLLSKIPESVVLSSDCERLCIEADALLEKSRITEEIGHDLETALVLCNAAAGKARAAMDAPYSNPHTMTFARMKHNTCVMRCRSLHRRILIDKGFDIARDQSGNGSEIRHTRDGSNSSVKHLKQNNKDTEINVDKSLTKTIEIYATLPKNKNKISLRLMDSDQIEYETGIKLNEKNSEQSKWAAETLLAHAKDTLKKHREDKGESKDKEKPIKKQHKIRRKLMGGLMRRKNRSMPDLTEDNAIEEQQKEKSSNRKKGTIEVNSMTLPATNHNDLNTSNGYLSEGHLDNKLSATSTNVNLSRSKLMRKSFHTSTARQLTQVKVPPPPPMRTNSTLSPQHLHTVSQPVTDVGRQPNTLQPFHQANVSTLSNMSSNTSLSEESGQSIITTCAQVHMEQSPTTEPLDVLPPYPSPITSANHSRQVSEDFPPPPSCIDLDVLKETLNDIQYPPINRGKQSNRIDEFLGGIKEDYRQRISNNSQTSAWLEKNKLISQNHSATVRDLASRFEPTSVQLHQNKPYPGSQKFTYPNGDNDGNSISTNRIAEEIREVEMLNAAVQQAFNKGGDVKESDDKKPVRKKSVSFCDQVILVATADDGEDDSFIPNPILERVLRTANNNSQNFVPLKNDEANGNFSSHKSTDNLTGDWHLNQDYITRKQVHGHNLMPPHSGDMLIGHGIASQSPYMPVPGHNYNVMGSQQFPQPNRPNPYIIPYGNDTQNTNLSPYQPVPTKYTNKSHSGIYPGQNDTSPGSIQYPQQKLFRNFQSGQVLNGGHTQFNNYPAIHRQDSSPIQNQPPIYNYQANLPNHSYISHSDTITGSNGLNKLSPSNYQQFNQAQQQQQQQQHLMKSINQLQPYQKRVSFEPGTKEGTDLANQQMFLNQKSNATTLLTPTNVPTRVCNSYTIVKASAKAVPCNLCRKKHVIGPALYCFDCETYMSRFQVRA